MAIKASGSLAFSEIRSEFPSTVAIGQNPCSMNEYRRLVVSRLNRNNGRYNEDVLPSGAIRFSDFYNVDRGFEVDIIIVGGGGGGGGINLSTTSAGGGGGGGGFAVINNRYFRPPFSVNGTVGRGGPPGSAQGGGSRGSNGTASTFLNNTANGGGGGGGGSSPQGAGGGCGGGGGTVTSTASGGAGNQGGSGGGSARTRNAEGGGGGGRTGNGQTAVVGGSDGSGGSGFDLNSWMGTANYRNSYGPTTSLGIAGGGGGGKTTTLTYVTGRDGGGYGCHPPGPNNNPNGEQFRDGVPRTGGGGGGGVCGTGRAARVGANGAGQGAGGVVIVRYTGSYRRDNSSGDGVQARSGTVNNVPHRFVVFGRADRNDITFNFTYSANANPVYAPP